MTSLIFAAALLTVAPEPTHYADTESVTNIAIAVNVERLDCLRIALDFEATDRANLEIALGTDTDGDGSLSTDETDVRVGYDCGKWKAWTLRDGVETTEPLSDTNEVSRTVVIPWKRFDPNWNLLRVTRRGLSENPPSVTVAQDTKYFTIRVR